VNVPLLDLQSQYQSYRDEALAAIARVCDSQRFIHGPEVEAFEAEMAVWAGVRHAVGVSSGTDALLATFMALGIGPGHEVVVPALSFISTANTVARVGATPVFADVAPDTLTLAPAAARAALSTRTRAIVAVHLYGLCADTDALRDVAAAAGVPLVEDAAQAIGATVADRPAGALGIAGCFSFYPTKNLGAFGDAGLVTTNDDALAGRLRLLRDHGATARYRHAVIGGNFRLDALQAAVLRVKLRHLAAWNAARRTRAHRYARLFAASAPAHVRALPVEPAGRQHVYHQYVILATRGDDLRAQLTARGVGTEVYYPVPLHRQACFATGAAAACPDAEQATDEVLALPMFPELTDAQQQHVVDAVAEFA
jgi:dTDP-4-amino-4,6-dideoxygalactose transaminase